MVIVISDARTICVNGYENIIRGYPLLPNPEAHSSVFTMKHICIARMRNAGNGALRQGGGGDIYRKHYVIINLM